MGIKLKTLGLALVAAMALTAVMASAASAAEFHSTTTNTTITGTQSNQHVFTVTSGTVKCTTATFSGATTAKTTKEVGLTPTYAGCKAFGLAATVHVNGCSFNFTANAAGGATDPITTDVVCPSGKVIEVTAEGCTVTVGPQTGVNGIVLHSEASGHIAATINASNIKYEEHGGSCTSQTVAHTTGTYVGNASLNGTDTSSSISYS